MGHLGRAPGLGFHLPLGLLQKLAGHGVLALLRGQPGLFDHMAHGGRQAVHAVGHFLEPQDTGLQIRVFHLCHVWAPFPFTPPKS